MTRARTSRKFCISLKKMIYIVFLQEIFTSHLFTVSVVAAHLTTANIRINNCLARQANLTNSIFLIRRKT
jgi:hypothetical protein